MGYNETKKYNVRKEKALFYSLLFDEWGTLFFWPRARAYGPGACSAATWGGWLGCLPFAASSQQPQSDKGIWGLRLLVARVDSGGGPNLPSVQRRAATSAPCLGGFGWPVAGTLAGGVTSNRVAVASGRQAAARGFCSFACSVGLQLELAVVVLGFSNPATVQSKKSCYSATTVFLV